jgi:hypothetical protein
METTAKSPRLGAGTSFENGSWEGAVHKHLNIFLEPTKSLVYILWPVFTLTNSTHKHNVKTKCDAEKARAAHA